MLKRLLLIAVWGGTALCASVPALERQPPPDFRVTHHELPPTEVQPWRLPGLQLLDLSVLVVALGLAIYFAHRRRSRLGLFWLTVGCLLYFGFYREGCVCPIGAIQNVTLALANPSYHLPLVVALFFVLPLLLALIVGRVFCSSVCPLGALQDVALLRPVKVAPWLAHGLGLIPYVYLGLAVLYAALGTAFIICQYDPFVGIFRMQGTFGMLLFGGALLALGFFIGRPYCRFLCPYGALLRVLSPLAAWRVKLYPTTCIQCRLCEEACPFGAIEPATPPPDPARRRGGRWQLAGFLALLPVLVAGLAAAGYASGPALARLHPRVALAEMVRATGGARRDDARVEIEGFLKSGESEPSLYADAEGLRGRFRTGGAWLGAWVGLVFGLKLIALSIRRRRTTYEADQAQCVACARCYLHCPQEHVRLGRIGAGPVPALREAGTT